MVAGTPSPFRLPWEGNLEKAHNRRIAWPLALAAVVLAILIFGPFFVTHAPRAGGPAGLAGESAPVFALRDAEGRRVSLADERGRIVVMNLWASWCPPCREEMPDLQRLSALYTHRGVTIVGVNEGESAQRARSFAGSLGIAFPIWIDGDQQYGRIYAALGLPTTVILDRNGVVVRGFDGALTLDEMRAAVNPLVTAR